MSKRQRRPSTIVTLPQELHDRNHDLSDSRRRSTSQTKKDQGKSHLLGDKDKEDGFDGIDSDLLAEFGDIVDFL